MPASASTGSAEQDQNSSQSASPPAPKQNGQAKPAESKPQAAAADPSKPQEMEGVTVSGYSASLTKAMTIKQTADNIVDGVSAEDAGKFPDINLAESLQRITGVQVNRLSSDGTSANEGSSVTVRGLPTAFNYVSLNGESIASASGNLINPGASRSFDFSVLAPDFISSLEVYKSPKADLTEGGIASTISVNTVMPIDIGKQVLKISAQVQESENLNTPKPNVAFLYSDVFADKMFGTTVGFSWNRRQYLSSNFSASQLDKQTIDGNDYKVLNSLAIQRAFNMYDTKTAYGAFQFRPSTTLDFSLTALHDKTLNTTILPSFTIRPEYGSSFPNTIADANNVLTTQVADGAYYEDANFHTWNVQKQNDVIFKATWRPGNWEIGSSLNYSNAHTNSSQIGIDTLESGAFGIGPSYQGGYRLTGGPVPTFIVDPNFNTANPNNYFINYAGGAIFSRGDIVRAAKTDATYHFDEGFIESIKFGIRFQKEINTSVYGLNQVAGASLMALTGERHPSVAPYTTQFPFSGGSISGAPLQFPYIDPQIFYNDYYGGSLAAFNAANPSPSTYDSQDYTVSEYDRSAYAMANYKFDWSIPVHGNFGVRLVKTGQSVTDPVYALESVVVSPNPTVGAPNYTTGPATPTQFGHSYSDALPSFNLTADLRDDLFLRAAVAESITRPTLGQLPPAYSISINPGGQYNLTSGNPDLDPFKAWGYDLSLEWYFAQGSMLSAAVFYKDVTSSIQPAARNVLIDGYTFNNTYFANGSGGHVKGVEANYIQLFDFLPGPLSGLGIQLNATYTGGVQAAVAATGTPAHEWENLSKWTTNATLFWEKDGWSARVSNNFRSGYLLTYDVRSQGTTSAYGAPWSTIDAQVSYDLNDHASVFVQGSNLGSRPTIFTMKALGGNDTAYPQTWIEGTWRLMVGGHLSF